MKTYIRSFIIISDMEVGNNTMKVERDESAPPVVQANLDITKSDCTSDVNGEEDGPKDHICELCHRGFTNKREFLLHQYNHKEKSSFYCAFCFKTFPSEFAFKRHNKFHEKKKHKMIKCRSCEKEFEYVKDLEEHHRQVHLYEKKFRCTHCKATFSWRENLNKHMRMHTAPLATKPDHKCEKCSRSFMDNISMRLHICNASKKPKEDKPDKPFVCKICSKAFKFDFSFEAHMNSHEGPVALSAYKKMQVKALEEKKQKVQLAATRQLQSRGNIPTSTAQQNPGTTHQQATTSQQIPIVAQQIPIAAQQMPNALQQIPLLTQQIPLLTQQIPISAQLIPMEQTSRTVQQSPDAASMAIQQTLMPTSYGNGGGPVQNGLNLQEIVLEIVNVNELPKGGSTEGGEILAQGGEGNVTMTLPAADMLATNLGLVPQSHQSPGIQAAVDPPQSQAANHNTVMPMDLNTPLLCDPGTSGEDIKIEEDTDTPKTNLFTGIKHPQESDKTENDDDDNKKTVKRLKRPLLYDYVMTEETPYQCPQCKKEFRWEISLNIHLQEHMGGGPENQNSRKKNSKKKSTSDSVSSKIVYKRDSDDEEDYQEGDFSYGASVATQKRKRGRPRKEHDVVETPKRKRGRPPKDPYARPERRSETVVIKVTQGSRGDEYHIKTEEEKSVELPEADDPDPDSQFDVHIPKHRLIRFYLLRQLKLSRNRGFFPCRFCNKPFSCKASLNMHILRHTGKGSYRCSHCHQKFPDHRTLVLHRLIEEEDAMDSAYQCNTCCRACSTSRGLMRHIQRHLAIVWPSSKPRAKVTGSTKQ